MEWALVTRNAVEIITEEELKERAGGVAYLGFEPSVWPIHLGWLVWMHKLADLKEAGFDVLVFVATWHAWINDKGRPEELKAIGERVKSVLEKFGGFKYVHGDEVAKDPAYWELALKTAKGTSLARVRRAIPIMGRRAEEVELDFSKLIYPILQVADIFYLKVDVAVGGLDQRRAHMLARDVAEKLGFKKPVALHTPVITGLSGVGRMEGTHRELDETLALYKMSKSRPQDAIFITDTPEEVRRKIWAAYCPPREIQFNPVFEIAAYLLLPYYGLEVGGRRFEDAAELERAYRSGEIAPQQLKQAVEAGVVEVLKRLGGKAL
ncbi:MAG: tyrosine--tRNA ligase [Thermoproteus sp.]|nr:tyrosine--tRNA ligase [Thermoproteus sp.]